MLTNLLKPRTVQGEGRDLPAADTAAAVVTNGAATLAAAFQPALIDNLWLNRHLHA